MEQAPQKLLDFVLDEKSMHDPLPWSELTPEQMSELYKQANVRGRATLIAGQIRLQCNLYVEEWTISLFWGILAVFGVLDSNEAGPDFLWNRPAPKPLPDDVAASFWVRPDTKQLLDQANWNNWSILTISTNIGALVASQWEEAFPEATLMLLEKEIQGNVEGFLELLLPVYADLWPNTFWNTLREAYTTPQCSLRELLHVIDAKYHIQINSESRKTPRINTHRRYRELKKRFFDDSLVERDASPQRMNHNKVFS